MNRKILVQAICCALITLSTPISSSFAASWTPQLLAPSGDIRKGNEPIRIQILGLPAKVAKTLTFEVDDIDVTSVVKQQGDVFTFTPTQAMAKGSHTIRIVENAADGSIIERGIWKIDIRKSRGLRESSAALNATMTYSRRVNDDGLIGPDIPGKNQGTGSFQFSGAAANKNWRLKANVDVVYNSQTDQTQRKHAWDVAQFLITHSVGSVETNIGHHAIAAPDSLIVQGLNRRGVSIRYHKPEAGFNFGGFAVSGSEVIGATGGLGAGNHGNYISYVAPGVDIWAASANGKGSYFSGTSYASPYVAALYALMKKKRPKSSWNSIHKMISRQSRDLGNAGKDPAYGWGLIQAKTPCR